MYEWMRQGEIYEKDFEETSTRHCEFTFPYRHWDCFEHKPGEDIKGKVVKRFKR